jgi:hypothetical protein
MHGVVGDRMVRSWSDMNQGSRSGEERRSWLHGGPEEPCPGSYADIASPVLNTTQSFTVAAWVKLNNANGYQTFVSEDTNVEAAFFLQLRGDSHQFSFTIPYDFFVNPQSGFTPVVGQWYHLAGVYDAVAHSATLYVNGLLADQIFFVNPAAATGHSSVGRGQFGGNPVDFVNGAIDDVRFYQAALTGAEILEIARIGNPYGHPAPFPLTYVEIGNGNRAFIQ